MCAYTHTALAPSPPCPRDKLGFSVSKVKNGSLYKYYGANAECSLDKAFTAHSTVGTVGTVGMFPSQTWCRSCHTTPTPPPQHWTHPCNVILQCEHSADSALFSIEAHFC